MWVVKRRGTRRAALRSRGMRLVGRGEGAVGGSARRVGVPSIHTAMFTVL